MRRIKKKDHENITDATIKKVIQLLNSSPAITKKQACEILNISYNTSRLNNIIESFVEQQELVKRMKAKKRGRPAENGEIRSMIESYLEGASYADISKSAYRSVAFVKSDSNSLEPSALVSKYIVKEPLICLDPEKEPIGVSTTPNVSGVK